MDIKPSETRDRATTTHVPFKLFLLTSRNAPCYAAQLRKNHKKARQDRILGIYFCLYAWASLSENLAPQTCSHFMRFGARGLKLNDSDSSTFCCGVARSLVFCRCTSEASQRHTFIAGISNFSLDRTFAQQGKCRRRFDCCYSDVSQMRMSHNVLKSVFLRQEGYMNFA